MNFRADINGLRAIGVTAVILFHFGVSGFQGGFVGVDAFFVISGYLMTGIIFRRLAQGRFSLIGFYLDRAKRIIPALAVLCVVLLSIGWLVLFPSDYKALGKEVGSAVTFISNIVFMRDSGYFDTAPHEKWLLHTWSLSVEWQFYLLYPVAVLFLRKKFAEQTLRWILLGFAIGSLLLSVYASSKWPNQAFYLLPTRGWEMLVGGLVYLFPIRAEKRLRSFLEMGGLALIAYSCLRFNSNDIWPGWLASVPVVGTAMVILASRAESVMTANAISQFLGKASYSIYLWHWPLVVGLHYAGKASDGFWIGSAIAASVLLGQLSLVFIENPTRKTTKSIPSRGRAWPYPVGAALAVAILGAGVFMAEGVSTDLRAINQGERSKFIEKYADLHKNGLRSAYRAECDFYDWNEKVAKQAIESSCTGAAGKDAIFLWGDSHAQALSLGLRSAVSQQDMFAQVATSGCAPSLVPQTTKAPNNNCDYSNQYALKEIERHKPGTVVIAQRWEHEKTDWNAIADRLHKSGVRKVVLVGPLPTWTPSLPLIVARTHWFDEVDYVRDGLDRKAFATDTTLTDKYGQSPNLTYVSMIRALCEARGCRAFVPGERSLMAVDYAHLSPEGSIYAVKVALAGVLSGAERKTQLSFDP
jgi:peptidoglycan/LPS O-acetylase OafA/YrhL